MPKSQATSAFSDPGRVKEAVQRATMRPRSLRRVGEVAQSDTILYEDRATGERRQVPRKTLLAIGSNAAYELATPQPEFESELDESGD